MGTTDLIVCLGEIEVSDIKLKPRSYWGSEKELWLEVHLSLLKRVLRILVGQAAVSLLPIRVSSSSILDVNIIVNMMPQNLAFPQGFGGILLIEYRCKRIVYGTKSNIDLCRNQPGF